MSEGDHRELADVLLTCQSKVVLSGQRTLIEQMLKTSAHYEVERQDAGLRELIDDIESGAVKPEVLFVSDVARLTRMNVLEAARLFTVLLEHGIEMYVVDHGNIDMKTDPQTIIDLLSE